MQTSGGYRYPSGKLLFGTLLAGGLGMAIFWWYKQPTPGVLLVLALGMVGSILMAGAFTPVGLMPPQGNVLRRIAWFLKPQLGTTVQLMSASFSFKRHCCSTSRSNRAAPDGVEPLF